MKKLLALIMCISLTLSMLSIGAVAFNEDDTGTSGGIGDTGTSGGASDTGTSGGAGNTGTSGGAGNTGGGSTGGNTGGGSSGGAAVVEPTPVNPFTEVVETAYYYDAVMWILEKGITEGVTETSFDPTANCTRAQMVTFLWRAAGCPEPTGSAAFVDVPANAYYYKAVLWAVEKGITNGMTANSFVPNQVCSRGQMAAFLYRHAGAPKVSGEHAFVDVSNDNYYDSAVVWLLKEGITNGTTQTTYSPNNNCTRGQMAAFLYRYLAE